MGFPACDESPDQKVHVYLGLVCFTVLLVYGIHGPLGHPAVPLDARRLPGRE
jgi:hypothetical protein